MLFRAAPLNLSLLVFMFNIRQLVLCLLAVVACLLASCHSGADMRYHNFPDAVTSLNQVDPAYRHYFASQQGRNYSVDDQRKALAAAISTSRTPVPAYVPRSAMASSRKAANRRVATRNTRKVANNKRRAVAKSKATPAKRRAVAKSKSRTSTKKAVAKRRSTKRRG
jgi:hypothetical protein